MRISIQIQREAIRLLCVGRLSNRETGRRLKLNHKTVSTLKNKFKHCGLDHDALQALDDIGFVRALGSELQVGKTNRVIADWSLVQRELELRDVTLSLLWAEYRIALNDQQALCLSYSQFCRHYKAWLKSQRISMRQFHKPGDKMFVDFCGRTIPITNFNTGEITLAQVFVAVLGASGYTFAFAVPSQKIPDWIYCHVQAFQFFGGLPQQIVPDNLKSAIIKHTTKELVVNRAYADMAEYYDVLINPARSRKPKDKSLAEVGVQIVQRWALAPLRHQKFFSVHELNIELAKRIEILNHKTSKKYRQSRYERFIELEQPALRAHPLETYEVAEWKYNVRVPDDYHVQHNKHFYSVPYQHRQQFVDIRVTHNTLEVILGRKRIASHVVNNEPGQTTLPAHMPLEHLRYSEADPDTLLLWAIDIGEKTHEWVRQNLQQRRDYANGLKSVSRLRRWAREEQNHDRLESACGFALSINALTFQRLQDIIRNNSDLRQPIETTSWIKAHDNVRGSNYYAMPEVRVC